MKTAYLKDTDLSNANLRGTKVENAYFRGSLGISNSLKQELINKGANFQDIPPDNFDKAPTPVKR